MNKLKPALLGGLITGILSVIPFLNTCCCIWAAAGGLLASFLYVRGSALPVSAGEGATVGALSGVVGGVIYLIIGLPIALIFGGSQMEEAFRRSGVEIPVTGIALVLMTVVLVVILLLVFGTIGGAIGVAIFGKRKSQPVPPPPQNYGGGPGNYGTGM